MRGFLSTLLFILFLGYIFIGVGPEERMERACKPTVWTGELVAGITDAFQKPEWSLAVRDSAQKANLVCQRMIYNVFFKSSGEEAKK